MLLNIFDIFQFFYNSYTNYLNDKRLISVFFYI